MRVGRPAREAPGFHRARGLGLLELADACGPFAAVVNVVAVVERLHRSGGRHEDRPPQAPSPERRGIRWRAKLHDEEDDDDHVQIDQMIDGDAGAAEDRDVARPVATRARDGSSRQALRGM